MKKLTLILLVLIFKAVTFSQESKIEVKNLKSKWYTLNTRAYLISDNKAFFIGWRGIVEISDNSKFVKVKKRVYRKTIGDNLDRIHDKKNNTIITATYNISPFGGVNIFLTSFALDKTSKAKAIKAKNLNVNLPCFLYSDEGKNYALQIEKNTLKVYLIDFNTKKLSLHFSKTYDYCKMFKSASNELLIASIEDDNDGSVDYKLEKMDFKSKSVNEINSFSFDSEYDETHSFDIEIDVHDFSRVVIIGIKTPTINNEMFRVYTISEINLNKNQVITKIIDDQNVKINSTKKAGLTILFMKNEIQYFEKTRVSFKVEKKSKEGKLEYVFNKNEERPEEFNIHEKFVDPYSQFSEIADSDKEKIRKEIDNYKVYTNSYIDEDNNLISNIISLDKKHGKIQGSWTKIISEIE